MIHFEAVAKDYHGLIRRTRALEDLSLRVRQGEIVGLVGPNGAGKTTLIQLALGYLRPTSGSIRVLGEEPGAVSVRSRIGWVPDETIYPRGARGFSYVEDWLAGHGLAPEPRRRRAGELFERFGLSRSGRRRIRTYSLGMQQKIGIILALSHEPDLLILDEPFSALDFRSVRLVRRLLHEFRGGGGAALVSSHHLPELETVCDRALFLAGGKLQREEVLGGEAGPVRFELAVEDVGAVEGLLRAERPGFLLEWSVDNGTVLGKLEARRRLADLIAFLAARQVRIVGLEERTGHLEETYLELEGDG